MYVDGYNFYCAIKRNLLDVAVARVRKKEPTESWITVRRRLERTGRLQSAR